MNKHFILSFVASAALIAPLASNGGGNMRTNPPSECKAPDKKCDCPGGAEVSAGCIKVNLDLGQTTPWSGSMDCALKIFADNESPFIFTCDSLYAVLGGYTFKRLGQKTLDDGVTPAEVVFSHPNGEPISFVFKNGESLAQPDPGVHVKMDERLMMVDVEGWATTSDPVYYDLYLGDGSRRRFMATDMFGERGKLASVTDARGVTVTPAEMGVDIVYDSNGVRQFLTPSRLAVVTQHPGFTGYDVEVYPIQDRPAKDAATGLYDVPSATPVKRLTLRRENGGRRAVVTLRSGDAEPKEYVFDYVMRDWSLIHPSGAQDQKEIYADDEREACTVSTSLSADGRMMSRSEAHYKWESWGYAMTNRVEGFDGATNVTEWTYYTSGNGKGQVKTEKRQSGLLTQYAYDASDRVISETRSGPGMMTEVTTYDYTPVDPSDPVLPVDTRPRTIVRKLNNIECERTYYVYAPLTNIVERVGTQGAAYGSTNALRTVTTFYPVSVGASLRDARSGFVQSIRHEDGKLDLYDYELSSNTWVRTVIHLHEQSPSPVSGKTTRDITLTNARGEVVETRTEAFVDGIGQSSAPDILSPGMDNLQLTNHIGIWYTIARDRMTYNLQGKRITSENLAGQVTTTAWDCCHKISETQPDGSTTTWDYDEEGRMIAASRLIPLDMTNVTWLTTCYEYDALGRQVATWQTNYAAQVGLPVERTSYDALGRVIARIDQLGNTTTTTYSPDGRTVSVHNPNTSTRVTTRSADGSTLSITGSAVTPEFHTYGISPDGTRWSRTIQGETASSPRFTKRYENLLGQTIREERSGFQGAVLATTHAYDSLGRLVSSSADYEPCTEYTYDVLGNRVATTKTVGRAVPSAPLGGPTSVSAETEWRKTEALSSFVLADAIVWLAQTNIVSCFDSAIAPLVTSSARQLTGLTAALPARSRTTDIRGNITENETLVDSSFVTSRQTLPYATNKPLSISRYGVSLMDVSVSAVTNTVAYDPLGRQIAQTDGRGNTKHAEYNTLGQRSASIDALGNRTAYAYDQFGNLASVINPLGHAIIYEYDLRGRKTYEGGATYPVRYTYDIFGNKTTMTTYRNESLGPESGDVTTWIYDEASDMITNKVYSDGNGPTYSYTPDGKLAQRIWARGVITTYSYDRWNNLTNTTYSDGTPTISLAYDALGRQISAVDAVGNTVIAYGNYNEVESESIIGLYSRVLSHHRDKYGRKIGYSIDGMQQRVVEYAEDSARIGRVSFADEWYTYSYLPGTDFKLSLSVGEKGRTDWAYENGRDLLTQVKNTAFGNVVSKYDYVNDAAGRRIEMSRSGTLMSEARSDAYSYNDRNELTDAVKNVAITEHSYLYDDIGNRLMSFGCDTNSTYAVNSLNQYTSISISRTSASPREEFIPKFDADGNQTIIQTESGVWQVCYNGENRPVSWSNGVTNITMKFDRMGRRVEYVEAVEGGTNTYHRFVYDGYLCVQRLDVTNGNVTELSFGWDPSELVAPRPLWMQRTENAQNFFYFHDGNKNVSDVVSYRHEQGVAAHYEYAPFGGVTIATSNDCAMPFCVADINPFRFSAEYSDDALCLVYYNFRHYNPKSGRWLNRDPLEELAGVALYAFCCTSIGGIDELGLKCARTGGGNIGVSGGGGAYWGFGMDIAVDFKGWLYDCCCDDGIKRRAWDIGLSVTVTGGVGIGGTVKLPYIGAVELLLKSFTVSDTFAVTFSKDCEDDGGCLEITLLDIKGNIGASFEMGLGLNGFISYYTSYEFKLMTRICYSGVATVFSKGWLGGGAFGYGLGPVDLGGEFGTWDFTAPFKPRF